MMSANDINIDSLSHEELVRLEAKIIEKITRPEDHEKNNLKIDTKTEYANVPNKYSNIDNTNFKVQRDKYDSETHPELKNKFSSKSPVQKMNIPPPPPPLPLKNIQIRLEVDPQGNNDATGLNISRSKSVHGKVLHVAKPRTTLQVTSSGKPPIATKPDIAKINAWKSLTYPSDKWKRHKMLIENINEVTVENELLPPKILKEFDWVVDSRAHTLKNMKSKNINKTQELINQIPIRSYIEKSLTMQGTIRRLPDLPNLPPKAKPRHSLKQSTDLARRISSISNNAIVNLQEKVIIPDNYPTWYDKDNGKSHRSNTANNYDGCAYDDDEPIYESIADGVYGPRPVWVAFQSQQEGSIVFNTLRRDRNERNFSAAVDTPPPLPPKSKSTLQKANTQRLMGRSDGESESETSSLYYDTRIYQEDNVYFDSYPSRIGDVLDGFDLDGYKYQKEKSALEEIKQSERLYIDQLEKIFGIYSENIGKVEEDHMKSLFGEIQELLKFHKDFLREFRTCRTLPQLGKLVIKMEKDFDIYRRDKWCKSTKFVSTSKQKSIVLPYKNWTENHLSMYEHLLKQLLEDNDPDVKTASIIITELSHQCQAVNCLKDIKNFPKIQTAGKFQLKDKFRVKVNSMGRGLCDVVLMEKYILCLSPESTDCFCYFNISKTENVVKKGKKSIFMENILRHKKLVLKSNDETIIDTWFNRYLFLSYS